MPRPKADKHSMKGIPENLKPLVRQGQRVRFNGGWLDDSEQDRFIAEWIDKTPNAWGVMKFLLHNALRGQVLSFQPQEPIGESDTDIEFNEAENAFLSFDD